MFGNFKPNPEQQACIEAVDGDYVVIAGPGSGKSTTLIERWVHMVGGGINTGDILNLTFTSSAAANMVEKSGMLDNKVFRTFHSYALDLIKRERQHVPFQLTPEIIPCGNDFLLMRDLLKMYPAITSFRSLKEKLSEWKCSNIDPEQAVEEAYYNGPEFFYACAYRDYEKKCREQGWLDFDSLMKETVKLLESNDEVRERNKKKYISVDECQDTDVVQFKLLKLIYGGNIFVVGDENQLIYEWRSAQSGNLSNFAKTFPGAKTLYLGQNYRSTKRLVEFFKKIIPVDNGLASHMITDRPEGIDPTITKFDSDLQEAVVTISRITDPANSAVIARTNRQLLFFQKRCLAMGLRSKIMGKKDLWQQSEVAHLLKLAKEKVFDTRPAYLVLAELIDKHNLTYIYRNSGSPNEKDPTENLNDLVKLSAKRGSLGDFLSWLNRLTHATKRKNPDPVLSLSTVHAAKGREWKHVFVLGVSQGLMPHKDGEILEEHRIFFVACSRAADTLEISFFGNRSEFLDDFKSEIVDYEKQIEITNEESFDTSS